MEAWITCRIQDNSVQHHERIHRTLNKSHCDILDTDTSQLHSFPHLYSAESLSETGVSTHDMFLPDIVLRPPMPYEQLITRNS